MSYTYEIKPELPCVASSPLLSVAWLVYNPPVLTPNEPAERRVRHFHLQKKGNGKGITTPRQSHNH